MRHIPILLLSVACLAVPYFSTLSHKQHDFRGFSKNTQILISWKAIQWEPSCTCKQTVRHTIVTNLVVAFLNFAKAPEKWWGWNRTFLFNKEAKLSVRRKIWYHMKSKSNSSDDSLLSWSQGYQTSCIQFWKARKILWDTNGASIMIVCLHNPFIIAA